MLWMSLILVVSGYPAGTALEAVGPVQPGPYDRAGWNIITLKEAQGPAKVVAEEVVEKNDSFVQRIVCEVAFDDSGLQDCFESANERLTQFETRTRPIHTVIQSDEKGIRWAVTKDSQFTLFVGYEVHYFASCLERSKFLQFLIDPPKNFAQLLAARRVLKR